MRLFLLTVGRIQEPYLREGIAAYQRRLEVFVRIEWRQFDEEPIPKKLRPADVKQAVAREGDRLLAALAGLPAGTHRIALALRGRAFTSEELAQYLEDLTLRGTSDVAWIVGGPLGLDPRVLEAADLRLSLSLLTFPHQLVPLILLEQLYRAFKILRREPYHY